MAEGRKIASDEILKLMKLVAQQNPAAATADLDHLFDSSLICPKYETKEVTNEDEVIQAIHGAKTKNQIVRAHGSSHSPQDHILSPDENGVLLTLKGELRSITMIEKTEDALSCEVGGGCFLGVNEHGKMKGTLCEFVHDNGFAIPILGGISCQTVSGFMMTSSAGGSLKHGMADVITGITFVDGNGIRHECAKGDDLFNAVGVSMGLFGIITYVKFRFTDKKFLVKGSEKYFDMETSFLSDKETFEASMDNPDHEYYHLNWFPQKYCNKVMQWVGKKVSPADNDIEEYKHPLHCFVTACGAAMILELCNSMLYNDPTELQYKAIGALLKIFVEDKNNQTFCDQWYRALPNDNQAYVHNIMKVDFTEVWVPRSKSDDVLQKLKSLYNETDEGQMAAGTFATEIYIAKSSPFWLSMSYQGDMLRIDPYWFHWNVYDKKRKFYSHVWDKLLEIEGARLHWGKYLPLPGQQCGKVTFNLHYLREAYDKMDDWLEKRKEVDPDQVFVNKYWRGILEIPNKA